MKYDIELYKLVNIKYGLKAQMIKAIEELSELQKELCKILLSEKTYCGNDIVDELADCLIMIDQMVFFIANESEVEKVIQKKLDRLKEKVNDL